MSRIEKEVRVVRLGLIAPGGEEGDYIALCNRYYS